MFGISFSELLLIFIIALVVFGPEQLPVIARKLGTLIGSVRKFQQNISNQLYQQTGIEQIEQLKEELNSAVTQIRSSFYTTQNNPSMLSEREFFQQEMHFMYQPELDFNYQPELFDE